MTAQTGYGRRNGARTINKHSGLTLLELLAAVALLGVLLTQALPTFGALQDKQRLVGVAAGLRADLRLARRQALRLGRTIYFSVRRSGERWCYGYAQTPGCRCGDTILPPHSSGNADVCRIGAQPTAVILPARSAVFTNAADFSFSATRGLSRTGRLRLRSPAGRELQLLRSALGRVRLCAPAGAAVTGYPPC